MENNQNIGTSKLFEEHPYFAIRFEPQFSSEDLEKIGIKLPGLANLPNGYIKLHREDFVVEEVTPEKKICTIEETPSWEIRDNPKARFVHLTMVKKSIATFEAIIELAKTLGISSQRIVRGGLKDAVAITSQRLSIDGVEKEKVEGLKMGNIFLKDVEYQRYGMHIGNLYGNRFTIMVRTQEEVKEKELKEKLDYLSEKGFPNFYSTQRFGRRLGAHLLGKKILLRDWEGVLKEFLSKTSSYEIPYVSIIRVQIQDNWRDWPLIQSLYQKLHIYFVHELRFVRSLLKRPNDFLFALKDNMDLTKLYYDAYVSFIFNKTLTKMINEKKPLPKYFPFFGDSPEALEAYGEALKEEGIDTKKLRIPELPFIQLRKGKIPVIIFPEQVKFKIVDEGAVISFILPKGAYATTFLSTLFNLREGEPRPNWVKDNLYDLKSVIGNFENELKEVKNEPVSEGG